MIPVRGTFRTITALLLTSLLVLASNPPAPARAPAPKPDANKQFTEEVLQEIRVPELLFRPRDQFVFKGAVMPVFDGKILGAYPVSSANQSKLRPAVTRARALLWAVSGQEPPADLAEAVKHLRANSKIDLTAIPRRYPVPANENRFREELFKESRNLAILLQQLLEGLEELQLNSKDRDTEPVRWRANYDFVEASLQLQIAQVSEMQSLIGQMRRELPDRDPKIHGAWEPVPIARVQGDPVGKRLAKEARKTLEAMTATDAGTPWEILSRRLKDIPIGLQWQAVK